MGLKQRLENTFEYYHSTELGVGYASFVGQKQQQQQQKYQESL